MTFGFYSAAEDYSALLPQKATISRGENSVADIPCRIKAVESEPLVDGVDQKRRKVIIFAPPIINSALQSVQRHDQLNWDGKVMSVDQVDDSTRSVGDQLIAYELIVVGA